MLSGHCLCGGVNYEVAEPLLAKPLSLVHCHCERCRKHHGAPFATFLAVPQAAVSYRTGQSLVREYRRAAGRVRCFCAECGSVTPSPLGEQQLVPAANLAEAEALATAVASHHCVASKASFHQLADDWPQHAQAAPGFPGMSRESPTVSPVEGQEPLPTGEATARREGSCLCGAVGFALHGPAFRWMQCHCSRCRRGRSAAHCSNAFFALDDFEWTRGQSHVKNYRVPEAERFTVSFCTQCGGAAPAARAGVPFVVVPAVVVDGPMLAPSKRLPAVANAESNPNPSARPQAHIFVADRASWYTWQDELPQFEGLPPS